MKNVAAALAICITAGSCVVSCTKTAESQPDTSVSSEISDDFDSLFNRLFAGNKEPGGAVYMIRDGKTVYARNFGMGSIDGEKSFRNNDSTGFNSSASSKTFTAVGLMKLIGSGKIDLNDKISDYFPEFDREYYHDITVKHLLSQTTGLPDLRPHDRETWEKYLNAQNSIFATFDDYRLYGTEKDHIKVFSKLDFADYPAGTHYLRHDPSFVLLAPLIERVTGVSFEKWMADNVFSPTGLNNTYVFDPSDIRPNTAHGYSLDNPGTTTKAGRWYEADYGEIPFFGTKADRGIFTTARDMATFAYRVYDCGFLPDSLVKLMTTPVTKCEYPNVNFCLGVARNIEEGKADRIYHLSNNGGYGVYDASWPEKKLHLAVVSNRNDWDVRSTVAQIDSILQKHRWI